MGHRVIASADLPLSAVLLERRRIEQEVNPNIDMSDYFVIYDGPKAKKVAVHWIIKNQHTGETNHHAVKIETFRRNKTDWLWDEKRSITLEIDDNYEVLRFANFLGAIRAAPIPYEEGKYIVIPTSQISESLGQVLNTITEDTEQAKIISNILTIFETQPEVLQSLIQYASQDPQASKRIAAALNMGRFTAALRVLEKFIEKNAREQDFQTLLEQNPWMFGSEYSELLPKRNWTRDEKVDFMLRRTADDYLEIIEIKTTLNGLPLFLRDNSHETLYPRSELSQVIGQVVHYLNEMDLAEAFIHKADEAKTNKIRAKIIIGRDCEDEDQLSALRQLNSHLHRIEILTFDQLRRTAERVLDFLYDRAEDIQGSEFSRPQRISAA